MQPIPLENLVLAFLPAAIVVGILHFWSRGAGDALYGFGRMVLQLSLIGYFLIYLFEADTGWIVLAVLAVMVLVASWISLRTINLPRTVLLPLAVLSVLVGGGGTLLVITQGVLGLDPWYSPQAVIPLAGMIFAASMTAISLAAERFTAELKQGEEYANARSTALKAALIPITNGLFAVGLVSLPGMMTGQILSGVSPLVAARYQIMVMCMMYGAAGLSSAGFLWLLKSRLALLSKD